MTKSGNPYHDKEGKFTSKENQSNGSEKILNIMGLDSNSVKTFHFVEGDIQRSVPQINSDGSKRIFVNDLPLEQRMAYIEKLREKDIAKPLENGGEKDTIKINSPERQAMREQLIENEIKKQLNDGEKKYDRKATIIFGLPASGKSTLAQYLKKQDGAFEIDSDFFTEQIPEFKEDPTTISMVHHEAGYMSKKMMNEIAEKGGNMIIGKVGGGADIGYLKSFLDDLAENDYEIELVLNDIPLEEGIRRNLQRHAEGNPRLVPSIVSIVADRTVFDNIGKLMNHPAVIGGSIYSNDVPKGSAPKFIRKLEKEEE